MENGSCELHFLATLAQETGVWKNPVLCTILSQEPLDKDKGKFSREREREKRKKKNIRSEKIKYLKLF